MKKLSTWKSCLAFAACFAVVPLALSCVEHETKHIEGVNAFIVNVVPPNGDFGTVDSPLTFPTCFEGECRSGEVSYTVQVGAYAVDIEGNFLPNYNDTVSISSVPGKLDVDTVTFVNGVVGSWTYENGRPKDLIQGINVGMRYAFDTTRIWLEDNIEKKKSDLPVPVCQNGREKEDGVYCYPSLATGVSDQFVFQPQTIRMIQYNPEQLDGQSPINKEYATIKAMKGHDLVVTNIVSTGFYITDLGDPEYNSLFIFTYSQPARVEIGDRVCEVAGGVAEYTGMTQLQFPSWGIQDKERSTAEDTDPAPEDGDTGLNTCIDKITGLERDCTQEELEAMDAIVDCHDVYISEAEWATYTKDQKKAFAHIASPEPRTISPQLLSLKTNTDKNIFTIDGTNPKTNPVQTNALERLESSVVTIQDIRLSTEFINCDDNGNSKIESGSEEAECRTKCQSNSKRCTELSNLESYDQWKAWTIDGNAELSVASSSLIANFDVTSDCENWIDPETNRHNMRCPERHLRRLTGNLKQILPGCSGASSNVFCYASKWRSDMIMTVIEPRIKTDLILDEEFNAAAKIAFDTCWADTRTGGCRETCMENGAACTCENFKTFRETYPSMVAGAPTSCP